MGNLLPMSTLINPITIVESGQLVNSNVQTQYLAHYLSFSLTLASRHYILNTHVFNKGAL